MSRTATAKRKKKNSRSERRMWTIEGQSLSQLLLATQEAFLDILRLEQLSQDYLRQSRDIIDEYAHFCEGQGPAHPWQLRHRYLTPKLSRGSPPLLSASCRCAPARSVALPHCSTEVTIGAA